MSRNKKRATKKTSTERAQNLPAVSWAVPHIEGTVLVVHAQPGAKRDAVAGEYDGKLKIALTAPPVDGKANEKLLKFLSEITGASKSSLELVAGETSRSKRILIRGISPTEIAKRLRQ